MDGRGVPELPRTLMVTRGRAREGFMDDLLDSCLTSEVHPALRERMDAVFRAQSVFRRTGSRLCLSRSCDFSE